jgi:peptidase C39-like protein
LIQHAVSRLAIAAALAAAILVPGRARAQSGGTVTLLDVPFIPQSELLCGGAAAAMVMRYWGATGVYAESFQPLVDAREGGIRGERLLDALQTRGWQARSFRGDAALVRDHLGKRRPVVALIQDRPGRFHYIVIVAWSAGRVIVHDPARAPFRVLDEAEFVRAWGAADFWTLLVLPETPPPATSASGDRAGAAVASDAPCAAMLDEGVTLAGRGDRAGARRLFEIAAEACPRAPGPWREMAGLHAVEDAWGKAAAAARQALARDGGDVHAARILATAMYVEGDRVAALDAWNRIGEPKIDLIDVEGLERTRFAVASRAMDLAPQTLLTASALRRAERRLAGVPSVRAARVTYQPGEQGLTRVRAAVVERELAPTSALSLVSAGVRAIADREVAAVIASPTGGGEAIDVAWRWWEHRPRAALGFSAPGPFGAVWRLEAFDERQSFGRDDTVVERRRGVAIDLGDWVTGSTRWRVDLGIDRWREFGRAASVTAGVEHHAARDRVVTFADVSRTFGGVRAWTVAANADWRSSVTNQGNVCLAGGGFAVVGGPAPMTFGRGAGTERVAAARLRAHPLFDSGIVDRAVFGRRLVYAGAEWRHWIQPKTRPIRFAPAVFVDVARAAHGWTFTDDRAHVDAGVGLRVPMPGAGLVRIDVARGLRDGATALSVGWITGLR